MRAIKFRAWDRLSKEMNYDDFDMPVMEFNEGIRDIQRERYILMQFTGLHDKNGKEIYEGDIVSDHNGKGVIEYKDKYGAFRVNYQNGQCKWFYHYLESEYQSIEVIGNVWEHPELVK